jgi:DNA-directed RNA polymerase specialized sigma24 family protein
MSKRDAGSRGVLAQIDARLAELDSELARANELLAERRRLLSARATLTGERAAVGGGLVRRITQDQVAAYLTEHPGARASEIAGALGVPLTTVSQHLHRGKDSRFERRQDGWHLRKQDELGKSGRKR